jgi:ketosteroid isomerase-like protein
MSRENVEVVRAGIEAFNHEDWDAVLEHAATDFVLDMSRSIGPRRGTYELDQLRSYLKDFGETFESFRIEADEFIEAGEHLVVPITAHAHGRDGIEGKARTAFVYTFRDGAVTRMVMYQGRRHALEAAGLPDNFFGKVPFDLERPG